TAVLCVPFCAIYFLIGNFTIAPVHALPLSAVDRWIGFHPGAWVWIYQSIYIPMNVIPWLSQRREDLRRYAKGFVLLAVVSFAVFVAYPVHAPKPAVSG